MKPTSRFAVQALVIIATVAALAGVAGAQQPALATTVSFDEIWADAEKQNAEPDARDYNRKWSTSEIWNDKGTQRMPAWPQQKAVDECVKALFPTPPAVRLVFRLDENGVVTQAFTDQTGYVDECVTRKTVGLRVPSPPSAPFLLCQRFEKLSEQRTVLTGCGPQRWTYFCEQQGNSSRCLNEFR